MRMAMRGLSIATGVLWLFMAVFILTALYSATQFGFEISSAEVNAVGSAIVLTLNITLSNGGFHDITDLLVRSWVFVNTTLLSNSTSGPFTIKGGETGSVAHDIIIDLADVAANKTLIRMLVLNDTILNVTLTVSLTYAYMVDAVIDANFSFPWGAPMSNLTVHGYRWTGTALEVDLSFVNKSPLAYNFSLEMLNSTGGSVGSSTTTHIEASSAFSGTISIPVNTAYMTPKWTLLAHVSLDTLDITVEVMSHG